MGGRTRKTRSGREDEENKEWEGGRGRQGVGGRTRKTRSGREDEKEKGVGGKMRKKKECEGR